MHLPTLLVASVAPDIEPFLVILLGLNYPLHGYLHTFLAAIPYGVLIGYAMSLLERPLSPLYRSLLLEDRVSESSFLLAGVIGTLSHVLLDSPLYGDIRPFYPIEENPLYNPSLPIHEFCVLTLLIGALMYLIILMRASIHRASNSRDA
ncbi:metal-dependent hydrolase [Candidatus Korarchaeum cryptofilum]|uniref:metal-dependent hydrolase n=1 Tax=Candidatus Korarchaeum cryptofilum TaxID=498846 RepID=UPI00163CE3A1|nr:metal-dependent hydrolase [Candidatus Korarchaeum cryptofilum]